MNARKYCSRSCVFVLLVWLFSIGSFRARGQAPPLNVIDFGARGDAITISVNTVRGFATITCPANLFTGADLRKVVELFGAGGATSPTNYQDLVANITRIIDDHTLMLDRACGNTTNGIPGIFGLNNAKAFQACIDACTGTNAVVNIPAGRYLLLSPQALNTNYIMPNMFDTHPAVTIQKGGITFAGAGPERSILLGCGAWQLKGSFAYRGYMFACQGPVTNDAPLLFDQLAMDGGASPGRSSNSYFPASPINGNGWDPTHDAVIDTGTAPYHRLKTFQNCVFRNWRGEMVKSVVSVWDGYVEMTNCMFLDGNATAFNFTFTHTIEDCYMSNLVQAVEFYQGYCSNACYFKNNTVTDMAQALYAVTGALTNHENRPYNIISNTFYLRGGQNGIQTTPAQNLNIIGNRFIGNSLAITLGSSGYQGSDINSNIVISGNDFIGVGTAIMVEGSGENSVEKVTVTYNSMQNAAGGGNVGFASGYGWSTNVVFKNNRGSGIAYGVKSAQLGGQWYYDDASNQFPTKEDFGGEATNAVSYAYGRKHLLVATGTNVIYALDDTHPGLIPQGAEMEIVQAGKNPAKIELSQTISGSPLTMMPGQRMTFYWNGSGWTTNSVLAVAGPRTTVAQAGL